MIDGPCNFFRFETIHFHRRRFIQIFERLQIIIPVLYEDLAVFTVVQFLQKLVDILSAGGVLQQEAWGREHLNLKWPHVSALQDKSMIRKP